MFDVFFVWCSNFISLVSDSLHYILCTALVLICSCAPSRSELSDLFSPCGHSCIARLHLNFSRQMSFWAPWLPSENATMIEDFLVYKDVAALLASRASYNDSDHYMFKRLPSTRGCEARLHLAPIHTATLARLFFTHLRQKGRVFKQKLELSPAHAPATAWQNGNSPNRLTDYDNCRYTRDTTNALCTSSLCSP